MGESFARLNVSTCHGKRKPMTPITLPPQLRAEVLKVNFSPNFKTQQQKAACIRLREAWFMVNELRKKQGEPELVLQDLSRQVGKSLAAAGHYFNGSYPLNVEWMLRFADFLKIGPPQLIFRDFWPYPGLTFITIYDAPPDVKEALTYYAEQFKKQEGGTVAPSKSVRKTSARR